MDKNIYYCSMIIVVKSYFSLLSNRAYSVVRSTAIRQNLCQTEHSTKGRIIVAGRPDSVEGKFLSNKRTEHDTGEVCCDHRFGGYCKAFGAGHDLH